MRQPVRPSAKENPTTAKFGVEDRMLIKNFRLRPIVRVRTAIAARMRQLQSNKRPLSASGRLPIRLDASISLFRQARIRVRRNHELIRIRPALVRHRDGFTSPNKARPAASETLPAAYGVFAGLPSGIPSQPSIGCTAIRLPNLYPPRCSGQPSGDSVPASNSESHGRCKPRERKCSSKRRTSFTAPSRKIGTELTFSPRA